MTDTNQEVLTIPCIAGDGIGVEITPIMQQAVDAALGACYGDQRRIEWLNVLAGEEAFAATGQWLPDETLAACRQHRVSIKGPLTTPIGTGIRSLNVALRRELDLFACVRPVRWFEGVKSPILHPENVDMIIFRENTEDVYAGIEWAAGSPEAEKLYRFLSLELGVTDVRFPETSGYGIKPISKQGSQRLIRAACQYAVDHDLPSVTLVHKGNIQKYTEGAFRQWGYELAEAEFPGLLIQDVIADAFMQKTLTRPLEYSVIATTNLNGDYISDLLAAQVGGIGIAPGANINYETGHAVFEATHGSAPSMVGQGRTNPSSLLLSAVMMLDYLKLTEAADHLTATLASCYRDGAATKDLAPADGPALTTVEFGQELVRRLKIRS